MSGTVIRKMNPSAYFFLSVMLVSASCASISGSIHKSEVYSKNHTGFYLYDPASDKVIADINSNKYFTPASNTKIFTLYTALNILGDSIPAFKYQTSEDSLIIAGTGDPTFLHPDFPVNRALSFLKSQGKIVCVYYQNFHDEPFGPGWAWDDYPYYFQPEKSPFPIYGNIIHIMKRPDTARLIFEPDYFAKFNYPLLDILKPGEVLRDPQSNLIYSGLQPDSLSFKVLVPFKYSPDLFVELLEDTLHKDVILIESPPEPEAKTYFSVPSDSLYKIMMQVSDNFFAEQILLMCADRISDTLKTSIAIEYSKTNLLSDLSDEPIWIDGSGLSRYNLFTPRSIVQLWHKIFSLIPEERLFNILASGGNSGTIKEWYGSDVPYIWGKTGTLSNNHALSGFIRTKKGETLIFSFMHNNYTIPTSVIKEEMGKTLWEIHEKY